MPSYKLKKTNQTVNLSPSDYLTEGGEGKIYVKNSQAYKIYFPGKEPPEGKLEELSKINNKNIIVPTDILLDGKTNKYVGNSMKFLDNNNYFSSAQIIPNAFWSRNNITHNSISCLIEHFTYLIKEIHKSEILLVDINEFNFLVDKLVKEIYCIDTNSYQTKHYPATAIMEASRDWHNKDFSELTDWFSFAILTFYFYSGIHPFRGGNIDGLTGNLDDITKRRILDNISVLNKKVKYPKRAVRDFNLIPKNWYDWYYNEFEKGQRSSPPDKFNTVAPIIQKKYDITSDCLILDIIKEFDEEIVRLDKIGGQRLTITKNHVYLDNSKYRRNADKFIIYNNVLMNVKITNNRLDVNGLLSSFECFDFFISDNNIYVKSAGKICKVIFRNNLMLASVVSSISDLTGKCYGYQDGFALENLAGEMYLILTHEDSAYQNKIPDLNKYLIIQAEKSGDFIIGYAFKNNKYYKFVIVIKDFQVINTIITKTDYNKNLCFIHHKNGFVVELTDDSLLLFKDNKYRVVKDKFFENGEIEFVEVNGEMYFSKDKILFKGRLK